MFADTINDKLYVVGHFKFADSIVTNGIASWDESLFDSLGGGDSWCFNSCGPILNVVSYNNHVFVAGYIIEMGNVATNGPAR